MKINGLEIKDVKDSVLRKHKTMYTILVPCYLAFAAFFAFVASMGAPMEEMWMVPIIGFVGAAAFIAVAVYMIKNVKAIKAELNARSAEEATRVAVETASAREEMKAYKALLDSGVISQEDYDAKLAELSKQG